MADRAGRPADAEPLLDAARRTYAEIGADGWLAQLDALQPAAAVRPAEFPGLQVDAYVTDDRDGPVSSGHAVRQVPLSHERENARPRFRRTRLRAV